MGGKMKRFALLFAVLSFAVLPLAAQKLGSQSVQNTLWSGFGLPDVDDDGNAKDDNFTFAGITDTVQARVDVSKFTMDGMLSWSAFPNLSGSPCNSFSVRNGYDFPDRALTQFLFLGEKRETAPFYINFIVHPLDGFDAGMGTKMGWSVGPEPYTDGLPWLPLSHVVQGDLSRGAPDAGDVRGFIKYGNYYADHALGARYKYKDLFIVGAGIDSESKIGDGADGLKANVGFQIKPIDFLLLAVAYQNIFIKDGNLYTGASIFINDNFKIDAWFGLDGIGIKESSALSYKKMWGTGAAVFIKFGKLPLWIRPEAGFSKYIDSDYTNAFYVGGRVNWDITERMHLGAWSSAAWGAEDKRWKDSSATKDYNGGFVWNIRPDFTFDVNDRHSVTASFEYEVKKVPNGDTRNKYVFGFFWKYNRAF
jgi:hypothetical protein